MKCERRESALALYVGGDLDRHQAGVLEQHLAACPRCRALLVELQASQGALKALATEPLDERALGSVRASVRAGLDRAEAARPWWSGAWQWVLAGGVVLGALGAHFAGRPRTTVPPPAAASAAPAGNAGLPSAPETRRETARASSAIAVPRDIRLRARRPAPRTPAYGLTVEEADQLARAVVALSRIERVPTGTELEPDLDQQATPTLMRLATADPDVVIYWQLNSDGG